MVLHGERREELIKFILSCESYPWCDQAKLRLPTGAPCEEKYVSQAVNAEVEWVYVQPAVEFAHGCLLHTVGSTVQGGVDLTGVHRFQFKVGAAEAKAISPPPASRTGAPGL